MGPKRAFSMLFGTSAVVVVTAAAAFACTNLATLNLSSASGKPGDVVKLTGTSFAVSTEKTPVNPVVVRWNATDGPVLAEVVPGQSGTIAADITIPESSPGSYVIVATQTKVIKPEEAAKTGHNPRADNVFGTPARIAFEVVGPGGEPVARPVGGPTSVTLSSEPSSAGIVAMTAALGALGLGLFAAGFVAFGREARRRSSPTPAPVRRD